MAQKMLINALDPEELRAAVVEDGILEAFYVEAQTAEQTRGNIYKGIVNNIEPALDAAFIDYGQPRHGFLQADELEPGLWADPNGKRPPIQEILKKGQQLLVQVVKDPQGSKGGALTTYLSIPGQSLVLTMGRHLSGVSRKVQTEEERKRLREVVSSFSLPANMGVIARTAALGRTKRELQSMLKQMLRLFEDVLKSGKKAVAPSLVHREEHLALRTVRDLFTGDVDEILVDDGVVYEQLKKFLALANPKRQKALHLYKESRPIFAKYNLENQIESIYTPKVELPSGASLVINPTEALISIDVNSGKAIKGKQIEETALSVNLEAAREIARQLRLRDLGGLVVIDFIDMRDGKHQTQVQKELKEALKKDKAKVDVGRLSRFGLLELSRQRIRPSIEFGALCACPTCKGRGVVRSTDAIARQVWRNISRKLEKSSKLQLNPQVASYVLNQQRAKLAALEAAKDICLEVVPNAELAASDWRLEPLAQEWQRKHTPSAVSTEAVPAPADNDDKPKEKPANNRAKVKDDENPPAAATASEIKPNKDPAGKRTAKPRSRPHPATTGKEKSAAEMVRELASPALPITAPPAMANGEEKPEEKPENKRRGSRRSGSARRRARKQKLAAQQSEENS